MEIPRKVLGMDVLGLICMFGVVLAYIIMDIGFALAFATYYIISTLRNE